MNEYTLFYGQEWRKLMENTEKKFHKDRECLHCEKFFDCVGKERGKSCLQFKERVEKNEYRR